MNTSFTRATRDTLNDLVEFDSPFRITEDGQVETPLSGIYAPEVFHDDVDDITIDGVPMRDSTTWDALTGFTGQYAYNGAVLHASEFLGGGLAQHVLDNPGVYVVTAVEVWHDFTTDEHQCPTCDGPMIHVATSRGEPGEHFICDDDDCRRRVMFLHDDDHDEDQPAGWSILRMTED